MLNNMAAPDACCFLKDILRDRLAQISGFDSGPASALPVLPLVQSGRIVLSLARCDAAASRRRHPAAPRATLRVAAGMLAPLSEARPAALLSGALAANYPGSILAKWDIAQMTVGQTQALARHALGETVAAP